MRFTIPHLNWERYYSKMQSYLLKYSKAARDVSKDADYSLIALKKPEKIEFRHIFLLFSCYISEKAPDAQLRQVPPTSFG